MSKARRSMNSKVILHGVTAPITALSFLRGQLGHLTSAGWETHLACRDDDDVRQMCDAEVAPSHAVPLSRTPHLLRDLRGLIHLLVLLRRIRPSVVVAGTPKMSLLLLLASWARRVDRRIYICHGLRLEGASGLARALLISLERLLARLATDVVPVSASVQKGLIHAGVPPEKTTLLGNGSPNGVDISAPYPVPLAERKAARGELGLHHSTATVLFLGRLTHDKGLASLLRVAQALDDTQFILAGGSEPRDLMDRNAISALSSLPNVHMLGHRNDVRPLYAASDLLILPTKREGLPTVVLEAAAVGLPTIAYAVTGTVDAIIHNETGLLVDYGNVTSLTSAARNLANNPMERQRLGLAARAHVVHNFSRERVWKNWQVYLEKAPTEGTSH